MLNVFYRDEHLQGRMSGPKKVIENLIRSLEDTDTPFSFNQEKYENNLFLHWDAPHIQRYQNLKNKETLLVGPQIWPFAPDFNDLKEYGKIIAPSPWVENLLQKHFNAKTLVWPVAIYCPDISDDQTIDFLIYHKSRSLEDVSYIKNILSSRGFTYTELSYGSYSQEDFRQALSSVKACAIIDNTESQGIAIQEMMAANKPLFVWDYPTWNYMGEQYEVSASSVPYWSEECGERVFNREDVLPMFEKFCSNHGNYCPADYVNRELSPQKSIQILLDHYAS